MNKQQEAIKLALEALESDPLDMVLNPDGHMGFRKDQAITAIREALAERKSGIKQVIELYDSPEQPAQQQEPVAICEYCEKERPVIQAASKPWVGLTDEDVTWLCNTAKSHEQTWGMFVRAIEAKLREKNA